MESSTAADFPHRDVRRSRAGLFENNLMSVAFDGCLGVTTRAKPCKGMMGIIEEGEEVMQEGKKKDDAAADLSLIAAAQRVEHYEASGYSSARNLAQQLRTPVIVQLLSASLAEEENADQLLNQLAQTLMSAAKMPAALE